MESNIEMQHLRGGALENNMYILKRKGNTNVVVIDPSDATQILNLLNDTGEKVEMILLTHGHFDHIRGVDELRKVTKAPVAVMEQDAEMLVNPIENISNIVWPEIIQTSPADQLLQDGQVLHVADMDIQVLHTPGHSPGSVCFLCEDIMISGDTLFRHTVGRTDLLKGSQEDMIKSFRKIFALDQPYRVFPGHGAFTTLDEERKENPFWLEYCQ